MAPARTIVFRTVEDPAVPARPAACPWPDANVFLGGRMLSLDGSDDLGIAAACAVVAGPLTPGVEVPFYAEFAFDAGDRYRAEGSAHVLTSDVPAPSVVLAACALRLLEAPAGVVGGIAASTSVFNPTRQPGVETGSIWTILAYLGDA